MGELRAGSWAEGSGSGATSALRALLWRSQCCLQLANGPVKKPVGASGVVGRMEVSSAGGSVG